MKTCFFFCLLFLVPHVTNAQSREAIELCQNVNPTTAWYECVNRYDARLREMLQDPRYQAERRRQAEELRLRAQEIENQQRMIEELERQRVCQSRRLGNTVQTDCN